MKLDKDAFSLNYFIYLFKSRLNCWKVELMNLSIALVFNHWKVMWKKHRRQITQNKTLVERNQTTNDNVFVFSKIHSLMASFLPTFLSKYFHLFPMKMKNQIFRLNQLKNQVKNKI